MAQEETESFKGKTGCNHVVRKNEDDSGLSEMCQSKVLKGDRMHESKFASFIGHLLQVIQKPRSLTV